MFSKNRFGIKSVYFRYKIGIFRVYSFINQCVIFTMDKANGENKNTPQAKVHFLLQKNIGNDECQIMTSKEVMTLALFSCHQPTAEDDDPKPTSK